MHISSSISGLYPGLVPTARKPAAASDNNHAVSKTVTSNEQASRRHAGETKREISSALDSAQAVSVIGQQVVENQRVEGQDTERQRVEELNVGALTRQFNHVFKRAGGEGFENNVTQASVKNSAQRAVATYTDVATQEHRQEIVALLGIDVFA